MLTLSPAEATAAAKTYMSMTPVRAADTRHGMGVNEGPVTAGQTLAVQVVGLQVPADAAAVSLNITTVYLPFRLDRRQRRPGPERTHPKPGPARVGG